MTRNTIQITLITSILLGLLLPVGSLVGWVIEDEQLVKFGPTDSPMQATTALAMVFACLSVLAGYLNKQRTLLIVSSVYILMALDAFLANTTPLGSVFDGIMSGVFYVESGAIAGRMSLISALNFFITAIVVLYIFLVRTPLRDNFGYAIILLQLVKFAVILFATLAFSSNELLIDWNNTGMSIPTVSSFLFVHISLYIAFHKSPKAHKLIFVAIALIIFELLFITSIQDTVLFVFGDNSVALDWLRNNSLTHLRWDMAVVTLAFIVLLFLGVEIARILLLREKKALNIAKIYDANRTLAISSVAHDVASPLGMMNEFVKMTEDGLKEGRVDDTMANLELMSKNLSDITHVVTSIVDTAINVDKQFEPEMVSVCELIERSVNGADIEKICAVYIECENSAILLPAIAVRRIVQNIVRNAAVHNDAAAPSVHVVTDVIGSHLTINITDNGPGIPPELRKKIFEPLFTRSAANKAKNSGLGLAGVKSLLDAISGKVAVKSPVTGGRGSTFSITVPISM